MTTTTDRLNNAPWPGAQDSWCDKITGDDGKEKFPLSQEAINWLLPLTNSVNAAPVQVGQFIDLTGQNDAIAPTDIQADLQTGLYLVSLWSLVEVPDGAASSVQITLTYTANGVIQTFVGTNVNGDTTTSKSQQSVLIWVDGGTVITYETSYSSTTPNAMEYQLAIALQLVKARA